MIFGFPKVGYISSHGKFFPYSRISIMNLQFPSFPFGWIFFGGKGIYNLFLGSSNRNAGFGFRSDGVFKLTGGFSQQWSWEAKKGSDPPQCQGFRQGK